MSFETYKQIKNDLYECIRPGCSVTYTFDGDGCEKAGRLFMTGETNISPYWKTEPDYQMLYRRIDDSLRSDLACRDRFCLDLSGKACKYPKIAFKKMVSPLRTPMFVLNDCTDNWYVGISAKAKDLKIYGYLRVCIEVRFKKVGVDVNSTVPDPDKIFTLDIPEGSYDWQRLGLDISFDQKNTANICYFLEGENYEGDICFEEPRFVSESGHNLVGQFLPHTEDRKNVNWMGQNLSRIEWIGLKVDINQKNVFDGEIFERCHRFSEAEIYLSENCIHPGENTITFTCTSNYRDAAGYVLREWGFISDKKSKVISLPESVTVGKVFHVCVEGKKGENIGFFSEKVRLVGESVLEKDGLSAVSLICDTPENGVTFELFGESFTLQRCVERDDDGVITGTGDLIYVHVDTPHFENYLKWYLSQNIGNMLTVRPTYRWNGTRVPEEGLYRKTADLLDSMGMKYSHMLDGRELPGCNANPTEGELESEHFLGRQKHENDGKYVYWGTRDMTGNESALMYQDLVLRMVKKYPEGVSNAAACKDLKYANGKVYMFRSPSEPSDMKSAAERFVESLRETRNGVSRHTGPATLFRYFYQAGYSWVGAELMYSPTELTISSLRGARGVYGGRTGAHNAVQWSTSPHDSESRYRRYRLAQFICYMQGVDEINTEEGLWRLEEYYNFHHRFSPACVNHTAQQQDFYRFVSTHTRRGSFYTPIAFLSGRYDGWRCFGRANTWGIDNFGFGDPERAWDVLTFYYPKSVLDALYVHNCPDEEIGYYSGTPNGNVDIVPIEANDFSAYRLLVAPGYNKAEAEDLNKLDNYVKNGGTLLIGWPQLSVTVDREKTLQCDHEYFDQKERNFVSDSYNGHSLSVCENIEYDDVILRTDLGRPLVTLKKHGKGLVYFVNAKEYAGAKAVDLIYREMLGRLTETCLKEEKIYARGNRNVQFTVYENEDMSREIYFIATDWHRSDPSGVGTLVIGDDLYTVDVPWGELVKVVAYENCALYPEKDENEVISLGKGSARVQGKGIAKFILCRDGEKTEITVDFTDASVKNIDIL